VQHTQRVLPTPRFQVDVWLLVQRVVMEIIARLIASKQKPLNWGFILNSIQLTVSISFGGHLIR
jgi:hypothetical protein